MLQLSDEELKKAQAIMLDILKEIHRMCQKHGINYFMFAGTLIGAVRHDGFIPWDDDIDIGMLRPDYEKFCEIAQKELDKNYFLQNTSTDKGYALFFSKVMKNNTKWIEGGTQQAHQQHHGLFVDVMPFDKIPASTKKIEKHLHIYRIVNYFTLVKFEYYEHNTSDNHGLLKMLFIKLLPKRFLVAWRDHLAKKYHALKNDYVITGLWDEMHKKIQPEYMYREVVPHRFENAEFYIPKNYDKILRTLYGDYMQIPPVEKRRTHSIIDFDFYSD